MNLLKSINENKTHNTSKKQVALITGASSGIGYAIAKVFIQEGFDIVAVARDQQRLQDLAHYAKENFNSTVYVLPADLTKLSSINEIENFLLTEQITIDALINNAGFGVHGSFKQTDIQKELDMVRIQIDVTLALTKIVLPSMIQKNFGYILNVASVYSFTPVPYQSVYGACKAFLLSFSSSLRHENKRYGIKVTTLCPGTTNTEFRTRSNIHAKINFKNGMSAEEVAKFGFKALMKGQKIAVPGLLNRLFVSAASHVPTSLFSSSLVLLNHFRGVNSKNT